MTITAPSITIDGTLLSVRDGATPGDMTLTASAITINGYVATGDGRVGVTVSGGVGAAGTRGSDLTFATQSLTVAPLACVASGNGGSGRQYIIQPCTPTDPTPNPDATGLVKVTGGAGGRGGNIAYMNTGTRPTAWNISPLSDLWVANGGSGGEASILAVPSGSTGTTFEADGGAGGQSGFLYAQTAGQPSATRIESGTSPERAGLVSQTQAAWNRATGRGGPSGDAKVDLSVAPTCDGYGPMSMSATTPHCSPSDLPIPGVNGHNGYAVGEDGENGHPLDLAGSNAPTAVVKGPNGADSFGDAPSGKSVTAIGQCGGSGFIGGKGGNGALGNWNTPCGNGGRGANGRSGYRGGDARATGGDGGNSVYGRAGNGGDATANPGNGGNAGNGGNGGNGHVRGWYGNAGAAPGSPGNPYTTHGNGGTSSFGTSGSDGVNHWTNASGGATAIPGTFGYSTC